MVMVLCDEFQERLGAAAARSEGGGRGAAGDGWAGLHAAGRGHATRTPAASASATHHLQAGAHRQQPGAVVTTVRILALLKTLSTSRPYTPRKRRCRRRATRRSAGAQSTSSYTRGRQTHLISADLQHPRYFCDASRDLIIIGCVMQSRLL